MKTIHPLPGVHRGFTLVELLIAMGISMILLAALSGIFAQSITTREKIDREGQKIETARYSMDTLAEDIRLAGYFGNYSPPFTGATPADWKYVSPCSTTGGNPLPGWNATTSPVQVPFPIFGYETHGTGSLPTALTDCLDNYRTGTDVFVIRRASTASVTAGGTGYVASDTYLQVSSCPDGSVDTQPFRALATTTTSDFNLHVLGCTSTVAGANSSVRKLITRIYYIAQCDDCVNDLDSNTATPGDGMPTLKMVELGIPSTGGTALKVKENVRTIAPGVENMHLEYGIDTRSWFAGATVGVGDIRLNYFSDANHCYSAASAGTTGTTAPTHTTGSVSDGGVSWTHIVANCSGDGSIDAWVVSNENPRQTGTTGDAVTGMRLDASTENRWEDVMAVKLFLVTRDLKTTTGHVDTTSFVMGSETVAATGDAYRRRLTSTTVKLVNMSGRRETP